MNRKLFFLLVFGLLALPGSAFARVYDVKLSGAQEVPANDSAATGECLAYLNDAQNQLTVICKHDVAGATAAHIHRAPAGENGSPILPFDNAASPFKGVFSVSAQDVADLMAGNLYVNVHSGAFADGEIRGQIGPAASGGVYFPLEGGQVVPPVDTSSSGACIGVLNSLRTSFTLACTNDVAGPEAEGIYRGMEGATGPLVFSLDSATTAFASVTAADLGDCPGLPGFLDDLWYSNLYVSVGSTGYPDGELRGQIETPQLSVVFPQFGTGLGLTSSVVLTNTSTTTEASGTVSFFDEYGQPMLVGLIGGSGLVPPSGPVSELAFTLDPLGTLTLNTDDTSDLMLGSAEVVTDVPLGGIIRFTVPGIGIAGFGSAAPLVRATTPVRETDEVRTALAIRNDESWPIKVTLTLLDGMGGVPDGVDAGANVVDVTIPAKGRIAKFVSELFDDPSVDFSGFTGSVMIATQDGAFSAIALEQGTAAGLFTSLPVAPVVGP